MSESPILASGSLSSRTGPGGEDLSLSELSLEDHTIVSERPFTLLARPQPDPSVDEESPDPIEEAGDGGELQDGEEAEKAKRHAAKLREEKLQSDIFILRKLNVSFATFKEALEDAGSANEASLSLLYRFGGMLTTYTCV